ncbi:MAG TPA: TOBE domain-containing protein [Aquabacterium sp.]|uniref:TOBE domain-containing protein n=1 Tax=Aquabacterium sp. TaxID=1872578 RepID=UPI002E35F212|nr:TOBE domain-containing protein [Aquabacterium sp.]HEX5357976.1 TOBE domain-containing protein [Aquabacterium sp.]
MPGSTRSSSRAASKSAGPRLVSKLEVSTELGAFLGDTRIRLLEAIDQHGSISQAAKHVPLSYKAAWDAVDAMNNLADQPLVERSTGGKHGGGTILTEHGRKVVGLYRAVEAEYQLALDRLMAQWGELDTGNVRSFQQLLRRMAMRTSARNQFVCTVSGLREGEVDYEVYLRLDRHNELVAVITRDSVEQLGIEIGMEVVALVKASAVLLMTDEGLRTSARNHLWGTVERVVDGPVNAEVVLTLGGGKTVTAVVTRESVVSLGLEVGQRACAIFKSSSVILSILG